MNQEERFSEVKEAKQKYIDLESSYWRDFSYFDDWQFWVNVGFLVIPLIVLFFTIDRKNIFVVGFFGYSVHVLMVYLDSFGIRNDWWSYPYFLTAYLASNVTIDASLIPVTFMLLYQWVLHNEKNYYLYGFIASVVFTFGLKFVMIKVGLFDLQVSYFVLLGAYLFIVVGSKLIVEVFLHMFEEGYRLLR